MRAYMRTCLCTVQCAPTRIQVPISPAKAGQEIGGKGGVSLVLLGVAREDSLSPNQIHSDLLRSIHFNPNSLGLNQIHPISLRFALTRSDSCNFTQICSASCRFTQIRSDSHPDSPDLIQTYSNPLRFTQLHSSFLLPLLDSSRFTKIYSDLLRQAPTDKS